MLIGGVAFAFCSLGLREVIPVGDGVASRGARTVSRLIALSPPPFATKSGGGPPDQRCLKNFAAIGKYSSKTIRSGIAIFVQESQFEAGERAIGKKRSLSQRRKWFEEYALIYTLNRYLFKVPNKPGSPPGSVRAVEGDEAWPVAMGRNGRLSVTGVISSYVWVGEPYSWDRDFEHCSQFGRRGGTKRGSPQLYVQTRFASQWCDNNRRAGFGRQAQGKRIEGRG